MQRLVTGPKFQFSVSRTWKRMTGLAELARVLREGLDGDQIRCLIPVQASLKKDVALSKTPGRIGTSLEAKRVARAGECTCPCVCSPMNTTLWIALPMELLQLVFSRLPLPKIIQLRSLSKSWNWSLTSEEREFMCGHALMLIREYLHWSPKRGIVGSYQWGCTIPSQTDGILSSSQCKTNIWSPWVQETEDWSASCLLQ